MKDSFIENALLLAFLGFILVLQSRQVSNYITDLAVELPYWCIVMFGCLLGRACLVSLELE